MSTILSTVNQRLVIPLSLGDCSTATNKAAYASRNSDHVRHWPSRKSSLHSLLWSLLMTPWN